MNSISSVQATELAPDRANAKVILAAMTKMMKMKKKRKRKTHPPRPQKCARSMRTLTKWVQAAAKAMVNARVTENAAQE